MPPKPKVTPPSLQVENAEEPLRVRKHPEAECETCPLYHEIYVPSCGPRNAEIALVGEAPGEKEAYRGEPFVGPSGQLMDQSLGQITDKEQWFKTNAVACWPSDKQKPSPVAIRACHNRLMSDLADNDPGLIVSLGASAIQSLRNDLKVKITKVRGRPFEVELPNGKTKTVVPTYHPAHILRQGSMWTDFKRDLELVGDILDDAVQEPQPEPTVHILGSVEQVVKALDWISTTQTEVAYDIESDVRIRQIRFDSDPITCIAFSWGEGAEAISIPQEYLDTDQVKAAIRSLFSSLNICFEAQNGKYDAQNLRMNKDFRIHARVDFDTMLTHYSLDERKGVHDLKQMAMLYEGAPDYEVIIKEQLREIHAEKMKAYSKRRREAKKAGVEFTEEKPVTFYGEVDRNLLYRYCGYDAAYTRRLARRFKRMVEAQDLQKINAHLIRINEHVMQMEEHGVLIDGEYRTELGHTIREELDRIEMQIQEFTWDGFNPNATRQVAKALFADDWCALIPPKGTRKTQDGNYSTAKDVLAALSGEHPLVDLLISWRMLKKLESSYVSNLLSFVYPDGRVRTVIRIIGTVTGRLSSTDPALMTLPKPNPKKPSIRNLVKPEAGNKLLEADYSQGELRVAAALSGEPAWVDAFNRGVDLHAGTMVKVGLGTLDDAIAEMGGDVEKGEQLFEDKRKKAKNTAFGTLYGMEEKLLAKMFQWPVSQARQFLNDYWSAYPTLKRWVNSVRQEAWESGELRSPFGRVRRYGLITQDLKHSIGNEASNYLPQTILSDCTLTSMMDLMDEMTEAGLRPYVHAIIFMHDSILLEVREDLVTDVAHRLNRIMRTVPKRALEGFAVADVPFVPDFKVGDRWGSMTKLKLGAV